VFEGLEAVQESEETNMLDYSAVQDFAIRMGYPETALWVREHRCDHSEGTFRGFATTKQGQPSPTYIDWTNTRSRGLSALSGWHDPLHLVQLERPAPTLRTGLPISTELPRFSLPTTAANTWR
jgi:hypothetical protein